MESQTTRIIITDTFDAAGNLVGLVREEDFEADGIVDARGATSFDAAESTAGRVVASQASSSGRR